MSLSIIRPGLLTTVQDLGRYGYQHAGIVVSGAMDAVALRVANYLVGNAEGTAGLEITLQGPTIRFEADHLIALTGAHLAPTLAGQPVPMHRPVAVRAGAVLRFGLAGAGCRAYLAVAGGLAMPQVLGSHATYLRAGFGGWEGRALQAGDCLPVAVGSGASTRQWQRLAAQQPLALWAAAPWQPASDFTTQPALAPLVRAVRGPEYEQFSEGSQLALWQQPFLVTPQSDRMGYRLQGPALERLQPVELLSSAVAFGTVQVPPNGQPIVLMADHQTTGGYPRVAQVASADFSVLAQLRPGQLLRFQEVSLAEAQALYLAQEQQLQALKRSIELKLVSIDA